jgi:NAD(P)-dependent dehydrogenase (short-subunit alcohol dehydrogenase family)
MNVLIAGEFWYFTLIVYFIFLFTAENIGASRGIGWGLVKQFLHKTNARVIATCRDPSTATELNELTKEFTPERLIIRRLDVTEDSTFHDLLQALPGLGVQTIDILVGNAGISNDDHPHDPVLTCNTNETKEIFETNVIGNLRLLQTFHSMLAHSSLKVALIMSSSEGSYEKPLKTEYSDPTGYRISKSSLNMLSVVYAIDPEVREAGIKMIIMHPGHVKTAMGEAKGQFAPTDIDTSTYGILQAIERASISQLKDQKLGLEPFQFSVPNTEIEKREHLDDFMKHLQSDHFVYVKYDGTIMTW